MKDYDPEMAPKVMLARLATVRGKLDKTQRGRNVAADQANDAPAHRAKIGVSAALAVRERLIADATNAGTVESRPASKTAAGPGAAAGVAPKHLLK
jgi:hypothetical protein